MGKNDRRKKNLKSERAKVHLKSTKTKFLPKGQNVTDTTFKVKPIILPQQFDEKRETDLLSRRKLNIKDLVTRIRHYNCKVKVEACEDLLEIIKQNPLEITPHLAQIIQNCSVLFQDKEHSVRKASFKVIDALLERVSEDKVHPFFEYISTNFRCAMTNIDSNIQEDALIVLDSLLKQVPSLVALHSEKILPNFFTLISKLHNSGDRRILTVNLKSKLTSIKWRIRVLSRLYGILNAIINRSNFDDLFSLSSEIEKSNQITYFAAATKGPITLFRKIEGLESTSFDSNMADRLTSDEENVLKKNFTTLVPILYQSWLEVYPESPEKNTIDVTYLNEESALMLNCILNIFHLLWEYIRIHKTDMVNLNTVFLSSEGEKFVKHLIGHFPYAQADRPKLKNPQVKEFEKYFHFEADPKCIQENILICYMYLVLYSGRTNKTTVRDIKAIENYLQKVFQKDFVKFSADIKNLKLLAQHILVDSCNTWSRSCFSVKNFLLWVIQLYNNNKLPEHQKLDLFNVLSKIACENSPFAKESAYENWVKNLPNLLLKKTTTEEVIETFLTFAKRNHEIFLNSFMEQLPNILNNFEDIKVTNSSNEYFAKTKIIDILYYLPKFDVLAHKAIYRRLEDTRSIYYKHLNDVLSLRHTMKPIKNEDIIC